MTLRNFHRPFPNLKIPSEINYLAGMEIRDYYRKNNLRVGGRQNYFSCLKNIVVSVIDPWICPSVCLSVCLQSYVCLTVKAVKASINVFKVSDERFTLL